MIFLVADGDYITGQQINVNGGASHVRSACGRRAADRIELVRVRH